MVPQLHCAGQVQCPSKSSLASGQSCTAEMSMLLRNVCIMGAPLHLGALSVGQLQINDLRKRLHSDHEDWLLNRILNQGHSCVAIESGNATQSTGLLQKSLNNSSSHSIRWCPGLYCPSDTELPLRYRAGQLMKIGIAFRQQRTYFPGLKGPRSDRCYRCLHSDGGWRVL